MSIFVSFSAYADTWYVSPAIMGGSDTNIGTETSPWRNIQHAVDQATAGDTIKVMDDDDEATDDYTENIDVNKSLTIERYNATGANPQIKANDTNDHVFYVTADDVTIKGLDIYGGTKSPNAGIYLFKVSDSTIKNNRCGWDSNHNNYDGIYLYKSNNNAISDNICNMNRSAGICLWSSNQNTISYNTCNSDNFLCYWGIKLHSSSNNTVSDNTCNSNFYYGINLAWSSQNTISNNTCNSNNWNGIDFSSSSQNAISDNTCSNNDHYGISLGSSNNNIISDNAFNFNNDYGLHSSLSSDNSIYLNTFSNNTNVYSHTNSTNIWHSPTKLGYLYGSSTQTYKSYMGNYYDDYSGSDSNNDGIGDTHYDLPIDEPDDEYPLMEPPDNYGLQTWWLANSTMYRGDMSRQGTTVSVDAGSSEIWAADQPAQTEISYDAGDTDEETTWTGQITFTSPPAEGDEFIVKVGYSDDQNGTGFREDGPAATLVGNDSNLSFIFTTNAHALTVPQGKYLALRITNNSSSNYGVRVDGSWSYVSASLSISGNVSGDVSGDGTVTAYDASLVLQQVVGLIELSPTQQEVADVSGNGAITAYDAALILQYVVELITQFPVQVAPMLTVNDENQLLIKIITELEKVSFSPEQKHVLEQLKRLSRQQVIPEQTALLQNYPNPFDVTKIDNKGGLPKVLFVLYPKSCTNFFVFIVNLRNKNLDTKLRKSFAKMEKPFWSTFCVKYSQNCL